ncbi:MAG: DUF3141 domain-containing protein [Aromatoleum sp.]|uniref:DUF3141 domain-containing protein n=1 Tax=Aromatoleum sp. TaxID=2307007 RepID=UPI002894C424|nr:DUF3141 domain-containing protein [Aromatoleum sp.]MDT3669380.1 DUF3141 domain-containing protein [Aromatoleum sp.]
MNSPIPTSPVPVLPFMDPVSFARSAVDYWRDTFERSVLFLDVMRHRGNQYLEHIVKTKPSVLGFEAEVLVDGRTLPRPVNYELMRIVPPEGISIDPLKRPFVVVDPRAGHGPGIGGFKPDSEIGVALRAGHPCYFIGFLPYPEPGQTVEDVIEAEVAFLRHVVERHSSTCEKPMVVGNCQAGWQIMMAAALEPDLFGPILIAGSPLSYWAGERGKSPMRYTGGLSGGSWVTALLSDMGGGLFDGAWLVQNFENMNPANTWWTKQYRVFANVDTEATRYLEFERWWGGHVVLGGDEIQYIVDNLFVGNRLSSAQLSTSDGRRIDLRNVRSPVVVFCSRGDDITPPPQALGWIRDLYEDVAGIVANEQTIVYCVHDSTGHLGIFVSGSVSRKEHTEFTANMDYIDVLPPGLYETSISRAADRRDAGLIEREYLLEFTPRSIEDLDEDVVHRPEDDTRFATVARVSGINLGLYRLFVQPWVRAFATPESARFLRLMHPSRLRYRLLSDRNPLTAMLPMLAEKIRADRHPVGEDNIFRLVENHMSEQIVRGLDAWGDLRDRANEALFLQIYGQPLLQALVGIGGDVHAHRRRPGAEPEHRRFIARRQAELRARIAEGGSQEAVMRSIIYVLGGAPSTDERNFKRMRATRAEFERGIKLADFKQLLREQFFILKQAREAALEAIPTLLKGLSAAEIDVHFAQIEQVLAASGELSAHAADRFERIKALFQRARPATPETQAGPASADPAAKTALPAAGSSESTGTAKPAASASGSAAAATPSAAPAGSTGTADAAPSEGAAPAPSGAAGASTTTAAESSPATPAARTRQRTVAAPKEGAATSRREGRSAGGKAGDESSGSAPRRAPRKPRG